MKHRFLWIAFFTTLLISGLAWANESRTLCVYDPSGANGDAFRMMKDYQVAAAQWGIDFELKPYTNEKAAVEDFKADKCDAALLTGLRVRPFVPFTGTIEAMGALQTYDQLKKVISTLAKPKARKLSQHKSFETVAIFPAGAVYLYVRDRKISKVSDLAGIKIATFDHDDASKVMVRQVGASMVTADLSSFAGMFNNKKVDACYAPATAYAPLELKKGLGSKGAIIKYPLAQLTLQILVKSDKFDEKFCNSSRMWAKKNFAKMLKLVKKAEASIPKKYWVTPSAEEMAAYDAMFQKVRIRLRDKEKIYAGKMLKLMRRLRCAADGSRSECAEKLE